MSDSALSPQEFPAAAEAHADLGPEYSYAVLASLLERVDQETAAPTGARRAGTGPPEPPEEHLGTLLKGIGGDTAVSGIAVLAVGGNPSERLYRLLWVLFALVVVCTAGAGWARVELG